VFDPKGRPVSRAEVMLVAPKPTRLVFTNAEGRYTLPLLQRGRCLVEARLGLDLLPQCKRVEVPETGEPMAVDFHLEPAGMVFGEILANGEPVDGALIDIYQDRESVLDTESENGFFDFSDAPPEGVALELRIQSFLGYPAHPVTFTWDGKPLNLGVIELERYPFARVKLRLPGGKLVTPAAAASGPGLRPGAITIGLDRAFSAARALLAVEEERVFIDRAEPGPMEVVLKVPGEAMHLLRATLEFSLEPREPVVIDVPQGPVHYRGRFVDGRGRPLRMRLAPSFGGKVAETDEEGRLDLELPSGGMKELRPLGLYRERWLRLLWPRYGWSARVLIDADRPAATVHVGFTRCVLVLARSDSAYELLRETERVVRFPLAPDRWALIVSPGAGVSEPPAFLLPPLREGRWHWTRTAVELIRNMYRPADIDLRKYRSWPLLRLRAEGLTVLDGR